MASAINGLKLVDAVGIRRTRPLLLGVILAIAIAHRLGSHHVVARLYLRGNQPAKLVLRGMPRVFGFVADKINTPFSAAVSCDELGLVRNPAGGC